MRSGGEGRGPWSQLMISIFVGRFVPQEDFGRWRNWKLSSNKTTKDGREE
jgi:hypothetical protein